MATFRVGQRVKTIYANNPVMKPLVGLEGTIVSKFISLNGYDTCYVVNLDGHGVLAPDGWPCNWHPNHLAPLVPPDEKTMTCEQILQLEKPPSFDLPIPETVNG